MTDLASKILSPFRRRWMLAETLKLLLLSLAPSAFVFIGVGSSIWGLMVFIICMSILMIAYRPWQLGYDKVSRHLDEALLNVEHSSGLLLRPEDSLTDLAQLQLKRISSKIETASKTLRPPTRFKGAILLFVIFAFMGFVMKQAKITDYFNPEVNPKNEQKIVLQQIDTTVSKTSIPKIEEQRLTINYPKYTGIASTATSNMSIKAVEGSTVTWNILFDTLIKSVAINSSGKLHPMEFKKTSYTKSLKVEASGFYNFEFFDTLGNKYLSELYAIEKIKDEGPKIKVTGIDEFNLFEYYEEKTVNLKASITDDFGIEDAAIFATLSSGEGEAIQFREEKLTFSEGVRKGNKEQSLSKTINLDKLKMKPGDELYFYVEASDRKRPIANISRSETYFLAIEDTLKSGFAVEGSLGADLMPDYFRSQRQLIIDTEKLINEKPKLTEKEFKFRSNELGFDQKALRLKYGQFMGDEADSGLAIKSEQNIEELEETRDGDQEDDPLADFTHDHDSEDHQHESQPVSKEENKEGDPLHDYLHDHDDPEESTFFEKSLKTKLREAMAQMWDSELYLRLYKPEQSLPFQYKALRLIQEIKNSARIYVHRIGFDPPPIKEEARLTGKLDDVGNYLKQEDFDQDNTFRLIKGSIALLEELIHKEKILDVMEQKLFEDTGTELATLAIEYPGEYLESLQHLKWLSEGVVKSDKMLIETQKSLLKALEKMAKVPGKVRKYNSELNQLLLKELQLND